MRIRDDGAEITDEDAENLASGVTSIERDPVRRSIVWIEFGDGSSTAGIHYGGGRFGWDRPEVIEGDTLAKVRALFEGQEG